MEATTDKTTPVNLAQHSYFNLNGQARDTVLNHVVYINGCAPVFSSALLQFFLYRNCNYFKCLSAHEHQLLDAHMSGLSIGMLQPWFTVEYTGLELMRVTNVAGSLKASIDLQYCCLAVQIGKVDIVW